MGAFLGGEIARRCGQLALVGQLLVGVVLGPSLLAHYDGLWSLGPELTALQLVGTIFIVFLAGLSVAPADVARMSGSALALGIAIFVVPFSVTVVVARVLLPSAGGLLPFFLGLTVSITALPVMGVMLAELRLLQTRLGSLLMSAAIVNELLAVSIFAILLRMTSGGTGVSGTATAILYGSLSVAAFLAVALGLYALLRYLDRSARWSVIRQRWTRGLRSREAGLALVIICVVGGSLFSQVLGLTYIVGAFYAGILVSQGSAGSETYWGVRRVFDAISWGLFLPLFFVFVGIEMDLRLIATVPALVLLAALSAAAILTKVGTGYSVARLFRWPPRDSRVIGHLTSSRGAVELAMAVVLLEGGLFSTKLFTVVAAVGLLTTLVAPIGAARALRAEPDGAQRTRS